MKRSEDADQRGREHPEHDRRYPGRQVERAHRRKDPPEQPQVGLGDVVEEALDPVQPGRVRQPQPARDDVREEHERVDGREDPDEVLRRGDRVREQAEGGSPAHQGAVRRLPDVSYAWLKKPPRSIIRARSSAETSTLRGVSRNTLSAIRCIPPSRAYVRPEAKSIRRFDNSVSVPWRLMITGTESLNWSAICWASLKLFGMTRWTVTSPLARPFPPTGRSAVERPRRGGGESSAKMSSKSSRRRLRRSSRRTFGVSR